MNFSRSTHRVLSGAVNPVSNRFSAAVVATLAALVISVLGSSQWASADSGTTAPDHDPNPSVTTTLDAPRHVTAKPGDESAAVAWTKPVENKSDIEPDGYIVTANPSGISVKTDDDDTLVIVEGLENGTEYTFTVVAFNEDATGVVSEPSNPIVPEARIELDEEGLERLREHLRKIAREARERLHEAEENAKKKLEITKERLEDQLRKKGDRANDRLDKAIEKARKKDDRKTEKARDWFSRLQQQVRRQLERAEGTERYDELRDRAENKLDKAGEKLRDRLEFSREKTDARIEKAEKTVERRIARAGHRAENALERTEERLTKRIGNLSDRLQELIRRLRNLWIERTVNAD